MDLRMSNITINLGTGEIEPVMVHVRLDTWNHWLYVIREMLDKAGGALTRVFAASSSNDDNALGIALEEEFRYGMLAISAAAFALDAFYASVSERHGLPSSALRMAGRSVGAVQAGVRDPALGVEHRVQKSQSDPRSLAASM